MSDLKLNAYYYSFAPTGQHVVDLILHAVARAGKAFHHTSQWTGDEMAEFYEHCEGDTCVEWIQNAANKAAAELAALRTELAVLRNNQLGPVPEGPLKALGAWVADHTDDDTWPNAERYLNAALAEMEALRAERAITASPWRYKEWGGLVVGGGEGSAEVLICTMATNTRHDEGRHNRELIIEAPTLRARLDKAEAEAARLRELLEMAAEYTRHPDYDWDIGFARDVRAALAQEGGPSGE